MKYIEHNGRIISKIESADTEIKRILGLMFRVWHPRNTSLLFESNKTNKIEIHMLFVFFSIDVIFLNKDYEILKAVNLKPFIGFATTNDIKYVIEMKAGTIKKFNLLVGSQLHLKTF